MIPPFQTRSRAIAQRSLRAGVPALPMFPVHLAGCPETSTPEMQYPLELDYDYDAATRVSFRRGTGLDAWEELLPPRHPKMTLPVGDTPLVDATAVAPQRHRAGGVLIKDESRNPTWSHKDRLNTYTVSAALYEGATTIVVASSGNHGVSAAALAGHAGLNCIVLTMPEVSPAFRDMILGYGAHALYLEADDRWPAMRELAKLPGVYPVSNLTPFHTGHPWGSEGYKAIAYEILSDLDGEVPAAVVVPSGYGEMLFGIHKGFREALRLGLTPRVPRLIAVEPAARGPLFHALQEGRPATSVAARPTIQSGTATTVGGLRATRAIRESGGTALLVTDESARAAHRTLARHGLWQEYSSSAAFAALDQIEALSEPGPIVVINCSTGLKEPQQQLKLQALRPDIASLRAHLRAECGFELPQ